MPTMTIKDIPSGLYRDLKKRALRHHRSLNSEVIDSLESSTRSCLLDSDDLILRARQLRAKTRLQPQSYHVWKEALEQGRP